MRTFTRRAICAAAAAIGLFASSAGSAGAQVIFIRATVNGRSLMALDVAGGSTAKFAPVIQWWPTGNSNQLWIFDSVDGSNSYRLQNVKSHMCLTSNGVAGAQVYQYPCQPNDPSQVWNTTMPPISTGGLSGVGKPIENAATKLCLDVNGGSMAPGAKVITWYCNNADNQAWI